MRLPCATERQCRTMRPVWTYFAATLAILVNLSRAGAGATNEATPAKPARPPLIVAVERGDRRAVEQLLKERADVEAQTPDGVTPLYAAAFKGHVDILKLLLKAGAKVDGRAALGRTALFTAAAEGHVDAVETLLDAGADPNARSAVGQLAQTPLHMAACEGQAETAKRLLKRGAKVNAWDEQRHITPLYLAMIAGHEPMAQLLLEHGANPAIADIFGQTPARAAAVMAAGKTRQLETAADPRLGFDSRAVVLLAYVGESQDRWSYRGNRMAVAFGDGSLIATAAHCVEDFAEAQRKAILAKPLVFSPHYGDVFTAEVVGIDPAADLAILRVAWGPHPALPLADDDELQKTRELLVAGYPPPEETEAIRRASRQVSAERLPVLQIGASNGPHQVTLGGARFIGPGWSGSPMILPGSGRLGGIFCRRDDLRMDDLLVLRNRAGANARAIRQLMSAQNIPLREPPPDLQAQADAAAAFSAALEWLDAQAGRPPREAVAAAEALVQRRPQSAQARRLLAVSASALRDPKADELADKHFREAVKLAPESLLVHASYGWFLDTRGRQEEGLAELEKAAGIEPQNSFVQAIRLKILAELKPTEAEILGQRLVAEGPENATYWFHYAGALRKLEKRDDALRAAQAAVRLAPKELAWYRGRLADLLARCGRLDEAESCHRELLEQRPDSPTFWLWYAQFLIERRQGRLIDARKALDKCESLNTSAVVPRKVLDELRVKCQPQPPATNTPAGSPVLR
ncbi:MAG TPA: ankyrin repeat domain-containing protein [Verrucomicrobiae bacterium]